MKSAAEAAGEEHGQPASEEFVAAPGANNAQLVDAPHPTVEPRVPELADADGAKSAYDQFKPTIAATTRYKGGKYAEYPGAGPSQPLPPVEEASFGKKSQHSTVLGDEKSGNASLGKSASKSNAGTPDVMNASADQGAPPSYHDGPGAPPRANLSVPGYQSQPAAGYQNLPGSGYQNLAAPGYESSRYQNQGTGYQNLARLGNEYSAPHKDYLAAAPQGYGKREYMTTVDAPNYLKEASNLQRPQYGAAQVAQRPMRTNNQIGGFTWTEADSIKFRQTVSELGINRLINDPTGGVKASEVVWADMKNQSDLANERFQQRFAAAYTTAAQPVLGRPNVAQNSVLNIMPPPKDFSCKCSDIGATGDAGDNQDGTNEQNECPGGVDGGGGCMCGDELDWFRRDLEKKCENERLRLAARSAEQELALVSQYEEAIRSRDVKIELLTQQLCELKADAQEEILRLEQNHISIMEDEVLRVKRTFLKIVEEKDSTILELKQRITDLLREVENHYEIVQMYKEKIRIANCETLFAQAEQARVRNVWKLEETAYIQQLSAMEDELDVISPDEVRRYLLSLRGKNDEIQAMIAGLNYMPSQSESNAFLEKVSETQAKFIVENMWADKYKPSKDVLIKGLRHRLDVDVAFKEEMVRTMKKYITQENCLDIMNRFDSREKVQILLKANLKVPATEEMLEHALADLPQTVVSRCLDRMPHLPWEPMLRRVREMTNQELRIFARHASKHLFFDDKPTLAKLVANLDVSDLYDIVRHGHPSLVQKVNLSIVIVNPHGGEVKPMIGAEYGYEEGGDRSVAPGN